ncbi:hypothetical protein VP01_4250g2, partial [Puccinia sorghi]
MDEDFKSIFQQEPLLLLHTVLPKLKNHKKRLPLHIELNFCNQPHGSMLSRDSTPFCCLHYSKFMVLALVLQFGSKPLLRSIRSPTSVKLNMLHKLSNPLASSLAPILTNPNQDSLKASCMKSSVLQNHLHLDLIPPSKPGYQMFQQEVHMQNYTCLQCLIYSTTSSYKFHLNWGIIAAVSLLSPLHLPHQAQQAPKINSSNILGNPLPQPYYLTPHPQDALMGKISEEQWASPIDSVCRLEASSRSIHYYMFCSMDREIRANRSARAVNFAIIWRGNELGSNELLGTAPRTQIPMSL